MNWPHVKHKKGKRILMLTPDIMIDRRILIEAETLVDEGYEVYLLAGHSNEISSLFTVEGRIKTERISFNGTDVRLSNLYKFQTKFIASLNSISSKLDSIVTRILEFDGSQGLLKKVRNKSLKLLRLFFVIGLRIKNLTVTLIAKACNKSIYLITKLFGYFSPLNAYEHLFFTHGMRYCPDIIHVHDLPMLKVGAKLKRSLKVPLVYDMHEFYPEQDCLTVHQQRKLRKIEKQHIKTTDVRITVNPMLAKEISRSYGNCTIDVVQNAMVIPEDFYKHSYNRFRQEYGIPDDKLILLYQGWISPDRNLQNLVTSMAHVDKPVVLVIMGYGDFKEDLKRMSQELSLGDRIFFIPKKSQQELLSYTASADIGIIPYPYKLDPNTKYSSPNKLYEFIAARLPILCNNLPFVSSLVEPNQFGKSYKMNDSASFAKAINNFPYNQLVEFKKNLKNHGTNFLWKSESKKLLESYAIFDPQ